MSDASDRAAPPGGGAAPPSGGAAGVGGAHAIDRGEPDGPPLRALPPRPKKIPRELRRKWGDRYPRGLAEAQLQKLVASVLSAHHVKVDIRGERLMHEWSAFVGDKIAQRTRPREIVGNLLVIEVTSSTWLHELRLLRPKLVADLLDKLGAPRLFDDVRLVLAGERARNPPVRRPGAPPPPKPPRPRPPPASGAMAIRILEETRHVEDPELRALIAKVRLANDK